MKINHFQITSASALNIEFATTAPICVLRGRYSDLALDLMRELIGDFGAQSNPDRVDDGRFVLHADIEMDSKSHTVCYIRNADFIGDNRIAANFKPNSIEFSIDDTEEYLQKRTERNVDNSNVLDTSKIATDIRLSESDRRLLAFEEFIKQIHADDDRPIFIYDFFDRIDEAVDITPYLNKVAGLNRQVFASICEGYHLQNTTPHNIHIVNMEEHND